MTALAFMPGRICRADTPHELKDMYPDAVLIMEDYNDLVVHAHTRASGSMFKLVNQFSPRVAESLAMGNKLFNMPREWYKELVSLAERPTRAGKAAPLNPRGEKRMNQQPAASHHDTTAPAAQAERGPRFSAKDIAGKFIHLTAEKNPKRPNTEAHKIFELYFTHAPIQVEEYIKLGARLRDIKCDVEKGFVVLKDTQ